MKLLTVEQAAESLGVSARRVRALITSGKLSAEKVGRDWLMTAESLENVKERKPGRPRKD